MLISAHRKEQYSVCIDTFKGLDRAYTTSRSLRLGPARLDLLDELVLVRLSGASGLLALEGEIPVELLAYARSQTIGHFGVHVLPDGLCLGLQLRPPSSRNEEKMADFNETGCTLCGLYRASIQTLNPNIHNTYAHM